MPDPRRTPARPDLAAVHLRGIVDAPRYVHGERMQVVAPVAPLRRAPRFDAALDTEALRGERVIVYDRDAEGWSWGQLERDRYVGYLPSDMLAPAAAEPTHRVSALRTFAFPGPSIKLTPAAVLPMGTELAVVRETETFLVTDDGLFVPTIHLAARNAFESDVVAVALRFLGTPYLWGGRTSLGIDCSGLVQTALAACGISAPRDSDMQAAELGTATGVAFDAARMQRGDLLFWPGHVAMACDARTIVHANAHHMAVVTEPAEDAIARIARSGAALSAIRRL